MQCDEIREQLEAFALGALDADEQASVERHLAECPECRHLANEYGELASLLPRAFAAAAPLRLPSTLKSRVLQSVAEGPRARTSTTVSEAGPKRAENVIRKWWPTWLRARTVATLMAVILLATSLAWGVQLNVALAQERALRAEFANLVSQQEVVLEVIDSNKTLKAVLRPPASGSPAYGKLYTRPDLPNVVVMAARLQPPPPGQVYQLWLTRQGQTQLAGTLAVNAQGFGLLVFDADRNGPVYEAARLTLQAEGSTTVSGTLVLLWEAPK